MIFGPVELLMIQFPGHLFKNEAVATLIDLIYQGTIHILDIVFLKKDGSGTLTVLELHQLSASESALFEAIGNPARSVLTEDDIQEFAATLEPNSLASVIWFEHLWVAHLRNAVQYSQGKVILNGRIPYSVMDRVINREISAIEGCSEQYYLNDLSGDLHHTS